MNVTYIILIILGIVIVCGLSYFLYLKRITTIQDEFYPTGELRRKYTLRKGLKNGREKVFYKSGELNKTKQWEKGKQIGKALTYYINGQLYMSELFEEYKLNKIEVYDLSGKLKEEIKL